MNISPEFRTWALSQTPEHPVPDEVIASRAAILDKLEAMPHDEAIAYIDAILASPDGLRTAGGPGSGNFGHAGRPGEVGGSAPATGGGITADKSSISADEMKLWESKGGWQHTGITWKQPVDKETGRPIPVRVNSVEEGAELVKQGIVVEVKDAREAHTLINKLAEQANEAKARGEKAADYDLCQVTVAGSSMFCVESLRTKEYPNGVPRLEMPQLSGKPVPGSEADKLTKDKNGEVNGGEKFISHLQGIGVTTAKERVPAANLRASQSELVGSKVAGMMNATKWDPGEEPIFVSSDNYVIDGHHRWAAVVGRDAADGVLGDSAMNIYRVNAPVSEVLHLANAWSNTYGIAQKAGVKKQDAATGLTK